MTSCPLVASCLFAAASIAQGAVVLNNGNFENTGGTFPTGWTTQTGFGTPTATTGLVVGSTTAANLSGGSGTTNQSIYQDFAPTTADSPANFQLDLAFRISAEAQTARIRFRGNNNATDIMAIRFTATNTGTTDSVDVYNGAFVTGVSGITITAGATNFLRITGSNFGTASATYTIGFSTDGVNYVTGAASTAFFSGNRAVPIETLVFEGGTTAGTSFRVDNVSLIPEPSIVGLGGLGMLLVLRRRR
ncbi:hypothetical protein KBB96_18795 [Luteolibacter ambystomatis]|uniref:PEP-CTERM sorting domain-containing protein n=1 Tax=Luteolibacter ambystomatis TaxID=2824561 RepID=A0A975IZZ1_9BACT|nr:hypothetical protein [Luteolibacter ambystomatis]QUE50895.1 hypothetical protein KBB96_18795 [Luteolibacter ambystomatis]